MSNMLQVILKNFINKKTTRRYPLAPERPAFERSRGRIACDKDTCILCSICARKCPADAITVDRTKGEWKLDAHRCIICGECVNSCPKKCITMSNKRRHSSSVHIYEGFQKEVPKPAPKAAPPASAKPAGTSAESPVHTVSAAQVTQEEQQPPQAQVSQPSAIAKESTSGTATANNISAEKNTTSASM